MLLRPRCLVELLPAAAKCSQVGYLLFGTRYLCVQIDMVLVRGGCCYSCGGGEARSWYMFPDILELLLDPCHSRSESLPRVG